MCDASNYAVEAVLGPKKDKTLHVICYTSKVLNDTQVNYGANYPFGPLNF